MRAFIRTAFVIVPFVASSLFAGPKIEFDTKTFKCGDVLEGKEKIDAVFNIKNIGDSVLKLENVRPGCGCTVVKYDTFVQPGKTAKIEASVKIAGYHNGTISKYINVKTNEAKEPDTRLTIEANIIAVIEVSETYINFEGKDIAKPHTLVMTSKKADLNVTDAVFKAPPEPSTPEWRAPGPQPMKFKLTATDSTRANGYRVFKLDLYPVKADKTVSGEITITTNHPDKKEIVLQATINK